MGWEITAVWIEQPDRAWRWMWRRMGDDSDRVIAESPQFVNFEECVQDAETHGLDHADCVLAEDC